MTNFSSFLTVRQKKQSDKIDFSAFLQPRAKRSHKPIQEPEPAKNTVIGRGYSERSTPRMVLSRGRLRESEAAQQEINSQDRLKQKLYATRKGTMPLKNIYLDAFDNNTYRMNRLFSGIGEIVCYGVEQVQWSPMSDTVEVNGLEKIPMLNNRPVITEKNKTLYINMKSLPLMKYIKLYKVKKIALFNGKEIFCENTDFLRLSSIYGEIEFYAEYNDQ